MSSLNAAEKVLKKIAQHSRLKQLAVAADKTGVRAMLVGGAVRDIFLGKDAFDVDVVVEYGTEKLARELEKQLHANILLHPAFGTAVLSLPSGEHIDLATARSETYPKPGSLPQVSFTTIENDLSRRDFTINAIAAPLSGAGEIIDPFGGQQDLASAILRVLHPASFQDDPTRIFRLARFACRGLNIDSATTELVYRDAAYISVISIERVREELLAILCEDKPSTALELLVKWGVWKDVFSDIAPPDNDQLDSAGSLVARLALLIAPCGQAARQVLTRLKLTRALKQEILTYKL
jgi:tRNA nucleotidyltransferase/poly(A) polymerase